MQQTRSFGTRAAELIAAEVVAPSDSFQITIRCVGAPDAESLLRRRTTSGGIGFCYEIDSQLFTDQSDHGPLLVAWDSNVLIDFHTYGAAALNDEELDVTDKRLDDLCALADLIHLWMIRDIRFLILPRSQSELSETTQARRTLNQSVIAGLEDALTFQLDDWDAESMQQTELVSRPGAVDTAWRTSRYSIELGTATTEELAAFPAGADRELVAQAVQYGVDVFLTQDRRIQRERGGAIVNTCG